jgi:hypothetical protein
MFTYSCAYKQTTYPTHTYAPFHIPKVYIHAQKHCMIRLHHLAIHLFPQQTSKQPPSLIAHRVESFRSLQSIKSKRLSWHNALLLRSLARPLIITYILRYITNKNIYIYIYIYIHTSYTDRTHRSYIHTYIHTYIHISHRLTYMHTYTSPISTLPCTAHECCDPPVHP